MSRAVRGVARFDVVAGLAQRLGVLLDAGIAPVSAWGHAAAGSGSPVAAAIVERGGVGRDIAEHVLEARELAPAAERSAWSALGAAWWVAVESGAPLAPTLRRFAEMLRSLAQSARDVEVALAGPLATSRIVLALPAVGLLFGALLGFDALRVLVTTAAGWITGAIGLAFIAVGFRWNGRLVAGARAVDATPGLALELLAIAVSGGASIDRSRQLVELALAEGQLPPLGAEADAVLAFARAAGVPAAAMLHAEAEELRRSARSTAQRRAAELGTRLLLPLGLCILPAFIMLGVAPVLLAIVSSTASGW
ncbi:type II secretion system F family protein [Lysinimonas soli]|uniref:Type II secretion system F family protein n=1 Tax=Lysinimonas soli TaxID=1074233 RepID=A0ABW0NXC1_9MICO